MNEKITQMHQHVKKPLHLLYRALLKTTMGSDSKCFPVEPKHI